MAVVTSQRWRLDPEGDYIADRRLYLDAAGKVVEADDPSRLTLLAPKGGRVPAVQAVALGLGMVAKAMAPAEDKAVKGSQSKAKG